MSFFFHAVTTYDDFRPSSKRTRSMFVDLIWKSSRTLCPSWTPVSHVRARIIPVDVVNRTRHWAGTNRKYKQKPFRKNAKPVLLLSFYDCFPRVGRPNKIGYSGRGRGNSPNVGNEIAKIHERSTLNGVKSGPKIHSL